MENYEISQITEDIMNCASFCANISFYCILVFNKLKKKVDRTIKTQGIQALEMLIKNRLEIEEITLGHQIKNQIYMQNHPFYTIMKEMLIGTNFPKIIHISNVYKAYGFIAPQSVIITSGLKIILEGLEKNLGLTGLDMRIFYKICEKVGMDSETMG